MKHLTHLVIIRHKYPPDYPHLAERDRLFLKTLNSLENQTEQDFRVVVLGTHIQGSLREIPKWIEENVHTPFVITTRLDNDDLVHPEFIAHIQAQAQLQSGVIDTLGYRYNALTDECIEFDIYHRMKSSSFISLMEPTKGAKGVYQEKHGHMGSRFPYVQIQKRLWCQVIHDTNKHMKWNHGGNPVEKPEWIQ